MTGSVIMDILGDREPDFWITDMTPNGSFVKIAEIRNTENGTPVRYKKIIVKT